MGNVRLLALNALLRMDTGGAYSNVLLNQICKEQNLDQKDSAFLAALFYGVLERRLTLDAVISRFAVKPLKQFDKIILHILRMGVYQLYFMDKIPASAAVNESVRLAKEKGKSSLSGLVNGILRKADAQRISVEALPLSAAYSCPEHLVRMWTKHYGAEAAENILRHSLGRPPVFIRVNTEKTNAAALRELVESQPVEGFPNALRLTAHGSVESLPCYKHGLFHVQDISSQLCCRLLSPRPGETVLDVCAAPGGKSFTCAQLMKNQGAVYAFDLHEHRVRLMEQGAERLGLYAVHCGVRDALAPPAREIQADRVLCDVPCSGLGIIRRKPEIKYKELDSFKELPQVQYAILEKQIHLVKPGGILFYSTCTLNPRENQQVAARLMREHPELEPWPLNMGEEISHVRHEENQITLIPSEMNDGFFVSAFLKKTVEG